jgi:hypothetical protein
MIQVIKQVKLKTKVIDDPKKIMENLHLGISIPILSEFHKYIINDLKMYNAKAIVLEEDFHDEIFKEGADTVVGNVIVYDDGSDVLFFGFFGVFDHEEVKIKILIDRMKQYAMNNGYKRIRGPINVPTVIFGWGFMTQGSNKGLFVGCPVNPQIYQKVFLNNDFFIKFEEGRYHGRAVKLNPNRLKYDYSEYEFVNPGKEGMMEIKDEFVRMHVENLPPSSRITPKASNNFDNLVDFIFSFGSNWMMHVVYYKPTNKIVAAGFTVPNPFSRDRKGRINSASFGSWVVDPDHRRKGLSIFMYAEVSQRACRPNGAITWGNGPCGLDNKVSMKASENLGFTIDRVHTIFECRL